MEAVNYKDNPDKLPYRSTVCWFLVKEDGTYTSRIYPLSLNYGYKKTFSQTFSGLEKDITYGLYIGYKGTDGVYQVTESVSFRYTDVPSGITNVNTTNSSNEIISLDGKKMGKNASHLPPGFYIKNGKKFIVK